MKRPLFRPITDLIEDPKMAHAFSDVVGLLRSKHFSEAIIQGTFYSINWKESMLVMQFLQANNFDIESLLKED